jgi:hypothetical protein
MIYDEALEELKCVWNGNDLSYPSKTIKALERAKKVEELLGLYQKLLKYIGLYNASTYCTKETLKDLEQKIKKTQNQINQLEEELK